LYAAGNANSLVAYHNVYLNSTGGGDVVIGNSVVTCGGVFDVYSVSEFHCNLTAKWTNVLGSLPCGVDVLTVNQAATFWCDTTFNGPNNNFTNVTNFTGITNFTNIVNTFGPVNHFVGPIFVGGPIFINPGGGVGGPVVNPFPPGIIVIPGGGAWPTPGPNLTITGNTRLGDDCSDSTIVHSTFQALCDVYLGRVGNVGAGECDADCDSGHKIQLLSPTYAFCNMVIGQPPGASVAACDDNVCQTTFEMYSQSSFHCIVTIDINGTCSGCDSASCGALDLSNQWVSATMPNPGLISLNDIDFQCDLLVRGDFWALGSVLIGSACGGGELEVHNVSRFYCPVTVEGDCSTDVFTVEGRSNLNCLTTVGSNLACGNLGLHVKADAEFDCNVTIGETPCDNTLTVNSPSTFYCPVTIELPLAGPASCQGGANPPQNPTLEVKGDSLFHCDVVTQGDFWADKNVTFDARSSGNSLPGVIGGMCEWTDTAPFVPLHKFWSQISSELNCNVFVGNPVFTGATITPASGEFGDRTCSGNLTFDDDPSLDTTGDAQGGNYPNSDLVQWDNVIDETQMRQGMLKLFECYHPAILACDVAVGIPGCGKRLVVNNVSYFNCEVHMAKELKVFDNVTFYDDLDVKDDVVVGSHCGNEFRSKGNAFFDCDVTIGQACGTILTVDSNTEFNCPITLNGTCGTTALTVKGDTVLECDVTIGTSCLNDDLIVNAESTFNCPVTFNDCIEAMDVKVTSELSVPGNFYFCGEGVECGGAGNGTLLPCPGNGDEVLLNNGGTLTWHGYSEEEITVCINGVKETKKFLILD
jgi:hypothetical protein